MSKGSLDDYKGSAWAIRELWRQAQRDLDSGRDKPARKVYARPNPAKTMIGWFKRRVLRGEFQAK